MASDRVDKASDYFSLYILCRAWTYPLILKTTSDLFYRREMKIYGVPESNILAANFLSFRNIWFYYVLLPSQVSNLRQKANSVSQDFSPVIIMGLSKSGFFGHSLKNSRWKKLKLKKLKTQAFFAQNSKFGQFFCFRNSRFVTKYYNFYLNSSKIVPKLKNSPKTQGKIPKKLNFRKNQQEF